MGTYRNGILGPYSGKVGTVVGSSWKGIAVIRSLPPKGRKKFNQIQLDQQVKFALMVRFLQPVTALVNQTYDNIAVRMSAFNKAVSYNIKNAIAGVYPAYTVNYSLVLLGRGDLSNASAPAAVSAAAGKLVFNWTDNSGIGISLGTDKAVVALYCEELNHWVFNLETTTRNAGTYSLDVPELSGKTVQTYLGFKSANGRNVSNTVYTGAVTIL